MRLIKSSVELLPQKPGIQGILEQIELAARTCYKSENNIKYDEEGNSLTAKDFVDRIVNVKKHGSIAEHGTIYLKVRWGRKIANFYYEDKYSQVNAVMEYEDYINAYGVKTYYITTNYRVILEGHREDDLQYMCEPTEHHAKRVTVRVKCPISVSREWNRHRTLSVSEQSSRYCNYSKDKFDNQVTFCIPYWIKEIKEGEYKVNHEFPSMWELDYCTEASWFHNLQNCENNYIYLTKDHFCKPQEAREVLPLCTATEVIYTGFMDDWKHFFELRCSENAHPDIRKLAIELQQQFKDKQLI
jgi:thymidylate synthase (FAD)